MIWGFLTTFLMALVFSAPLKAADSPAMIKIMLEGLEQQRLRTKDYFTGCENTRCQFLNTIVEDDYRTFLGESLDSYKACLKEDGKQVLMSSAKNSTDYLKLDEYNVTYAKSCNAYTPEKTAHTESKSLYLLKRLELFEKDLLEQYAVSESILNQDPLAEFNCQTQSVFPNNTKLCTEIKAQCDSAPNLDQWVTETQQAIKDLEEIDKKVAPTNDRYFKMITDHNIPTTRDRMTKRPYSAAETAEMEKLKEIQIGASIARGAIYQKFPWMKGDKYKEYAATDLKKAITEQLKENQKALLNYMKETRKQYGCLTGQEEGCSYIDFHKFIKNAPEMELEADATPTQIRNLEINQCFASAQLKDEREKKIAGTVASVATLFAGSVLLAPRLIRGGYALYQGARTLGTAANIAVGAAATGAILNNSVNNIKENCIDQKMALDVVTKKEVAAKSCSLTSENFKNARAAYNSCVVTAGLEAFNVVAMFGSSLKSLGMLVKEANAAVGAERQVVKTAANLIPAANAEKAVVDVAAKYAKYGDDFEKASTKVWGKPGEVITEYSSRNRIRIFRKLKGAKEEVLQVTQQRIVSNRFQRVDLEDKDAVIAYLKSKGIDEADIVYKKVGDHYVFFKWENSGTVPMDNLTGFMNATDGVGRSIFNSNIQYRIQSAATLAKEGQRSVLINYDVDFLKVVNTFGFHRGDRLLSLVGQITKRELRGGGTRGATALERNPDSLVRSGGDEYEGILTITAKSDAEALKVVTDISKRVETAVAKSPEVRQIMTEVRAEFKQFRIDLAQTKSFLDLNAETRRLVQSSPAWKTELSSSPSDYQKFIREFTESPLMQRMEQKINQIEPGVAVGGAIINPGTSIDQLRKSADAMVRNSKDIKARTLFPDGTPKPVKEDVRFSPSPTQNTSVPHE